MVARVLTFSNYAPPPEEITAAFLRGALRDEELLERGVSLVEACDVFQRCEDCLRFHAFYQPDAFADAIALVERLKADIEERIERLRAKGLIEEKEGKIG